MAKCFTEKENFFFCPCFICRLRGGRTLFPSWFFFLCIGKVRCLAFCPVGVSTFGVCLCVLKAVSVAHVSLQSVTKVASGREFRPQRNKVEHNSSTPYIYRLFFFFLSLSAFFFFKLVNCRGLLFLRMCFVCDYTFFFFFLFI